MKQLTPEELQHRIDHYHAVADAKEELFFDNVEQNLTKEFEHYLYLGKADAYKDLLKELYPDIGSDRVYPLDLEVYRKQVEQIKSMYNK